MKKETQCLRTMKYFIDAAQDIMAQEGIAGVTTRKVADKAGYNSATLYNYFENLDELIFYASLQYMRPYTQKIQEKAEIDDCLEEYISIWHSFSEAAFSYPDHYLRIFFAPESLEYNDKVRQYYKIYPEELERLPIHLIPMFLEGNIHKRDYECLQKCVLHGRIKSKDLMVINDMNVLIFESFLRRVCEMRGDIEKDIPALVDTFVGYIRNIVNFFKIV